MSIPYYINNTSAYLEVTARGKGDKLEEVEKYVNAVISAILENKSRLVFCDELELTHELSKIDTYALGKIVSQYAMQVEKVAIICKQNDLPKQNFYQLVTNNRGLYIRVFTDPAEGKAWLFED